MKKISKAFRSRSSHYLCSVSDIQLNQKPVKVLNSTKGRRGSRAI